MNDLFTYHTIRQNPDGSFSSEVSMDPEHPVFKAHFPGKPVLPGVVMLRLFREMIVRTSGIEMELSAGGNLKFIKTVVPGVHPFMEIHFRITEDSGEYRLSGHLIYGEETVVKMEQLHYKPIVS